MHVESVFLKAKHYYNYRLLNRIEKKNLGENTGETEEHNLLKGLNKFFEAERNLMWRQDHLLEGREWFNKTNVSFNKKSF